MNTEGSEEILISSLLSNSTEASFFLEEQHREIMSIVTLHTSLFAHSFWIFVR